MKIRYLVAASAAALMAASGAQAADVVQYQEPAAVVAPAFNWQGFYVGGQIGGAWSDTSVKARNIDGKHSTSPDPSGFIGGLYAGYNYDAGYNVILGLETDFTWGDLDDSSNIREGDFAGRYSLKQSWNGATRIRVGYTLDRWLPYIAGGVAYGDVKARGRYADVATNWHGSKTFTGWTIGAGVDYAVTDNVLVRLEYRYTDFGDETIRRASNRYNVEYKTNDFRVGVAYKF